MTSTQTSTGKSTTGAAGSEFDASLTKGDDFTSFDVNAFEVPQHKDEQWRFTPLRRLRGLHDSTGVEVTGEITLTVGNHDGDELAGVSVERVATTDPRIGEAGAPRDRTAAQAFSSSPYANIITIAAETTVPEPVVVRMQGPGSGKTAFAHTQIRVEKFARATVVLDQTGGGNIAENVEFIVGDSGYLEIVTVQDWDSDSLHLAGHHLKAGRDAQIRYTAASFGGELIRVNTVSRFTAPGGDIEMFGLYFADDGQHIEHRLLVDHDTPHCRSNIMYKGALQGDKNSDKPDAHTVWVGDVLIRAAAEGTDTYELNRNLVLTDGARADSVPNLEIETGEIQGAGHASTTGRFDDEQLFYLCSRGITEEVARRLVVRGFFGEIIQKISVPQLRERLAEYVEQELALAGV